MVELRGFEPLTSSVQRRRSPGLSYSPTLRRDSGLSVVGVGGRVTCETRYSRYKKTP